MENVDTSFEELKNSEKRYRLLLDTMKHGVQENDCEGTITYSNRAHHRILGYAEGELLGKKIWDVLPSLKEQDELKNYFAYLVQEQPSPEPYHATNIKKDGSPVELQIDWDYKRKPDGGLKGFISVITDITERIHAEENIIFRYT